MRLNFSELLLISIDAMSGGVRNRESGISDDTVDKCHAICETVASFGDFETCELYEYSDGQARNTHIYSIPIATTFMLNELDGGNYRRFVLLDVPSSGLRFDNSNLSGYLSSCDKVYALSLGEDRMKIPIICANSPYSNGTVIIDGWHRVYNAIHNGIGSLPMFLLTDEERDASEVIAYDSDLNIITKTAR